MLNNLESVALLGTLPPIRALSSYCFELAHALVEINKIEFISFKSVYPAFLYPGGDLKDDYTYPENSHPNLHVRRCLAWYNPISWIIEGFSTKGQLLHAQWWSLPLFPIYLAVCLGFKLRRKPVVITVHNVLPHEKSRLYICLSKFLFMLGDHFVVHSENSRQQMENHYRIPRQKISVIPHGRLDFFACKDADPDALRKEFGYSNTDKIILIFGAIRPYKGVDIALQAFARILRHFPEARLLIAGKLWESWEPYDRLINELGISDRVSLFLNYLPTEDVHKYFGVSDLAIFPYRHFDSQSGAGAAAVSFHKPMIVSNAGGLPELASDPACIVPPDDPDALAAAIIKCFKDPDMIERIRAGMEQVARKLDWSGIAVKTAAIYDQLLKSVSTLKN